VTLLTGLFILNYFVFYSLGKKEDKIEEEQLKNTAA
jgi:hypothetical protein